MSDPQKQLSALHRRINKVQDYHDEMGELWKCFEELQKRIEGIERKLKKLENNLEFQV